MRVDGWFTKLIALLALGCAGEARAQEPVWAGVWRVDGSTETRDVAERGDRASLVVTIPEVGRVQVDGPGRGPRARLEGKLARSRGAIGVLEGRPPLAPFEVALELAHEGLDSLGVERARVRVLVDGAVVREERWGRDGPARLEIVLVDGEGRGGFDPLEGQLTVRFRVLGRPQRPTLEVHVDEGLNGPRVAFYRAAGLSKGLVRRVASEATLEPGEHELVWDGRDGSRDRRIALGGSYRVVVDSPERRGVRPSRTPSERDVLVRRPRALFVCPRFERDAALPPSALERIRKAVRGGYRIGTVQREPTVESFTDDLASSALGVVFAHGMPALFGLGDSSGHSAWISTHSFDPRERRLKDVHAVFIYACETGKPGRSERDDLPRRLLAAGADVVVSFVHTIFVAEARPYHDSLAEHLLEQGASIRRAVDESSRAASEAVWGVMTPEQREHWLDDPREIRPLKDSLRVVVAGDIDEDQETLMPARHGCSTN